MNKDVLKDLTDNIEGLRIMTNVQTDIVERPAIVNAEGLILICTPEMAGLPVDQLKLMAKLAKGRLVWRKYEVIYSEVISKTTGIHAFCDYKGCEALAAVGSDFCGDKHQTMSGM